MQNFKSNHKAVNMDTIFTGLRKVMNDGSQAVLVAAGKIGSVEVKEGVSVMVYGTENNWTVQATMSINGRIRFVAEAKCDNSDF